MRHVRHSHPHEHVLRFADGTVRRERVTHAHHHVDVSDLDLPTFAYGRALDKGLVWIRPWGERPTKFPPDDGA